MFILNVHVYMQGTRVLCRKNGDVGERQVYEGFV